MGEFLRASVPNHHRFYLESSNHASASPRAPCNKQTINAGDNPCPTLQSPLPYMLAGLAAMVLLVVISLMILACSYLRGYFSVGEDGNSGGSASANTDPENPKAANLQASQQGFGASPEKIVVILAGQDKPTHLAQPVEVSLQVPEQEKISFSCSCSEQELQDASALEMAQKVEHDLPADPATITPST